MTGPAASVLALFPTRGLPHQDRVYRRAYIAAAAETMPCPNLEGGDLTRALGSSGQRQPRVDGG